MPRPITNRGWTLLLLPAMCAAVLHGQNVSPRLRGDSGVQAPAAAAQQPTAPAQPAQTAQVAQTAPSMLQQPAREAQIVFADDSLSIRADNASLAAILHQVAATSGMKIDGLGGDERVFGSFGPGAPRDVLADLLNGTAYNLVLIGDLTNGAPRELILSPTTHSGAAAPTTPAPQVTSDDAANDPEPEVPPPPPPPPEATQSGNPNPSAAPGVRTPQQLFEQLQRMRQNQQSPQQQQPVQQDSPQQ